MKLWIAATIALAGTLSAQPVFNVRDYGATGASRQRAPALCSRPSTRAVKPAAARSTLPPGEYTSGQLHLRSGVRLYLEAGATLFASLDGSEFDSEKTAALFYGEDLHDIALEGRGTLDGQASYEWRPNNFTDFYILCESAPDGSHRQADDAILSYRASPRNDLSALVLLLRCEDVRITGLKFLRSRSWTINPYACKRLLIDGVYIYSSQKEAVWADGIDPDGCQDVRISNSTIETGDDALVFYSADIWGPALPTENVTVTNCRLSSASSAIKFCDGNSKAIRRVAINNVVITNSNRGIAFMVFDGGIVEDVVISNLTDRDPPLRLVLVGRWRSDSFQHQAPQRGGRQQARQRTAGRA